MAFLTQSRFPSLWLLIQNLIDGNMRKQALAIEHYFGQKRVLKIGCSVENISATSCAFQSVSFTEINIDRHALDLTNRRFHNNSNFSFFSFNSIEELSRQRKLLITYSLLAYCITLMTTPVNNCCVMR